MDIHITPSALVRAYIWQLLQTNLGWKSSDYDGLVPVVPVSEEPELTEYNKPYIVYGYAEAPTYDNQHYCNRGSMTFLVYSTTIGEINAVMNVLSTALGREDDTARDINNFTSRTEQFKGMRFGTVSLGFGEGPSPEESEGGRQSALLNIRFEYFVDYPVKTDV